LYKRWASICSQALEQHTFPLDAVQGFMEHLLPAMRPNALPADAQAYGALCDKLAALSLPPPEGQPSSPAAAVTIRGRMDGVPMMI
jgi:hypothetical protein